MIEQMESAVLAFFQSLHTPVLDRIMVGLTTLGNYGAVWILLGILLLFKKKYRMYGVMVLSALLIGLLVGNGVLKNLIGRARPCWCFPEIPLLIPVPADYSFPSGHTLASFEAVTVLFFTRKKALWIPLLVLASLVSVSRMYLFVHYPTDILAGMALGIGIGVFTVWMYRKLWKGKLANESV